MANNVKRVMVNVTDANIRSLRKTMTVTAIAKKYGTTVVTLYRRFGKVLKLTTKARRSK